MRLAIIGYGALGRQIEGTITDETPAQTTVYFDDNAHRDGVAGAVPFAAHTSDDYAGFSFYVGLGYKHLGLKQKIIDQLLEVGRVVPHFVHPRSFVHRSVKIGAGSIIYAGCTVDRNTAIGRGVLLNNGVVIAHDGTVGPACWFSPGVTLSGEVTVGERTFVGSGATIANNLEIGSDVVIGLSTAVTKPVEAGQTVIGNPMRVLARRLTLV